MVRNEVEADDTRWPPLVEHDVFNGLPARVLFWRGVGEGIVVKGQSDERGRSGTERLDVGEHTRTLLARRCRR